MELALKELEIKENICKRLWKKWIFKMTKKNKIKTIKKEQDSMNRKETGQLDKVLNEYVTYGIEI